MDLVFLIESSLKDSKLSSFVTVVAHIGPRHTACDQKLFDNCIRVSMTSFKFWKMSILMACSATNTFNDISSANVDQKLMAGYSRPSSCPRDNCNKNIGSIDIRQHLHKHLYNANITNIHACPRRACEVFPRCFPCRAQSPIYNSKVFPLQVYVQVRIGKSFRVLLYRPSCSLIDSLTSLSYSFACVSRWRAIDGITTRTSLLSRYSLQQSMFAPLSKFGSIQIRKADRVGNSLCIRRSSDIPASMDITLKITFSTLCTGLQRSEACSYIVGSSPGVCSMEMQTLPSA
jgi:hypothetical protein